MRSTKWFSKSTCRGFRFSENYCNLLVLHYGISFIIPHTILERGMQEDKVAYPSTDSNLRLGLCARELPQRRAISDPLRFGRYWRKTLLSSTKNTPISKLISDSGWARLVSMIADRISLGFYAHITRKKADFKRPKESYSGIVRTIP